MIAAGPTLSLLFKRQALIVPSPLFWIIPITAAATWHRPSAEPVGGVLLNIDSIGRRCQSSQLVATLARGASIGAGDRNSPALAGVIGLAGEASHLDLSK